MTKDPVHVKPKRSVVHSALAMAMGTFSSRILGFLRDALMFALFPRSVTDAWVVAFRLPNIFRRMLGEGSLSPSFIPVYVEARQRSAEESRRLANAVFSILFAVATVLSVACFVYMDQIMARLIGDPAGLSGTSLKVEQTVYLARIMIFYLVLVTTYAFHTAVANTHGHFFKPALGPTLFNFGLILFTLTHLEAGRYPGSTQAWGVIFGGVLQVGVVAWLLWRERALPTFTLFWRVRGVGPVFTNMLPGLIGLGVFQVMSLVNTRFAASLSEGAQSYMYAADRVLELPQSLIAVSLGTALLPLFADLHSRGERKQFLHEANQAVRNLLFLALPAAVGMFCLSRGLTEVLFMRGAFNSADAEQTAMVVQIYGSLMLFSSVARVIAPAFYALRNTWLPAAIAFVVLAVHIGLGHYLVSHHGLRGLAIATATSAGLNVILLLGFFNFMIGSLGYGGIFRAVLKQTPALVVLGAFCGLGYPPLVTMLASVVSLSHARTGALGLAIGFGMALYFWVSHLFGSEESRHVLGTLRRRLPYGG